MDSDIFPIQRVGLPPSKVTGDLFRYLSQMARELNRIPRISITSYGNPNSNVTGQIGDVLVNLVTSTATSRLWLKELGSSNTGWSSLATA